jgi:hypothetical protein
MSNQSENTAAANKFRDELKAMCGDISQIDKKVLTAAVNTGLKDVKKNTPVDTGTMRKNWHSPIAHKIGGGIEKALENPIDYAPYVNNGHRIVNSSGETTGFVEGKFMLEHAVHVVDAAMSREFEAEVRRIQQKHDK